MGPEHPGAGSPGVADSVAKADLGGGEGWGWAWGLLAGRPLSDAEGRCSHAHTEAQRSPGGGQFSAESPSAGRHFLSGEDWFAVRECPAADACTPSVESSASQPPGSRSGGSAWPPSGAGSPAPRSLTALLGGPPRLRGHAPSEVTRPFGGRVPNGCPSCSLTPNPSLAPRSHPGTHRGTTFPAPVGLPPPAPPRTHKPRKEAASLVRRGGCPGGVPLPCETNTAPSRSLWAGISASHSTEGKKHLFLNISTVTVK